MPNLANIIEHGFRTCGLSPFSSNVVDFNVLNKKKKKIAKASEHVNQEQIQIANKRNPRNISNISNID